MQGGKPKAEAETKKGLAGLLFPPFAFRFLLS